MVGSCQVTRRMLVLIAPGGRSWKARPSISRESSRRRRKSAVYEGRARVQRFARSSLLQVFRRAAEGKARRPAVRASAVPIVSDDAGSHLAYWRPKSLSFSAKTPWSAGSVAPCAARRSAVALSSHELWARTLAKSVRAPSRVRARRIADTISWHLARRTYGVRIRLRRQRHKRRIALSESVKMVSSSSRQRGYARGQSGCRRVRLA